MKKFFLLLLITFLLQTLTVSAQKPKPKTTPTKKPVVVKLDEKTEFENAAAVTDAAARAVALAKFLNDFPTSENKVRTQELLVSARAQAGEEKLRSGETEAGLKFFKLAASDAPQPMSDDLFTKVILQFPTNLFFRGQQSAAVEIAKIIEEKAEGNAKQILGLSTFYLGIENGNEAKRLAEKALTIDANFPAAYQTLGLANRLNFELDESVNAYTKALELDVNSTVSRRSLAEMKRAVGKPNEAVNLYREILAKDADDASAQTGLVLSLFDDNKVSEAETELSKSLEANPTNLLLLVGTAYWYAAHNQSLKAVELAQKAVALEPRYTWAHIALARAYLGQNNPAEAEKSLLAAREYGNFPTLDYEMATVRAAAGFYEEAARDLRRSFTLTKGDTIKTRLGNRISKDETSFIALLAPERRASIFQTLAADSPQNAERMKNLLKFAQKLEEKEAAEAEISEAADNFVNGDDKTRTFRQIYASTKLLDKKIALSKSLELIQSAVRGVDSSLEISAPTSFVLADELFESRRMAMERGQLVIVPNLERRTLSNIMRGRIEEISGWTLYQQKNFVEASVRLKRAVSILPEKSAWWRSSLWRLGAALEAAGNDKEALDAYIKNYVNSEPDPTRRSVIENVYERINGTRDGLEARLNEKPKSGTNFLTSQNVKTEVPARVEPVATPSETTVAKVLPSPGIEPTPTIQPIATPAPTPEPTVVPTPEIKEIPQPSPEITPEKTEPTQPNIEPTVTPSPTPEATPEPTPEVKAETTKTPEPMPEITPETTPTPEVKTEITPEQTPQPTPLIEPSPTTQPETTPTPETQVQPTPIVETTPTPQPDAESSPKPEPTPNDSTVAKTETKTETKPETSSTPKYEVIVTDNTKTENSGTKTAKPLFEPVVISVPKLETAKPKTEKIEETNSESNESAKTDEGNLSGNLRPRVVITSNLPEQCILSISQETVSIINGGGTIGILVGYVEEKGDLEKITATSSNPEDIYVELDKEVGKQSNRAFFIIKSISPKTGIFTVTFDSPCGKSKVQVRVR